MNKKCLPLVLFLCILSACGRVGDLTLPEASVVQKFADSA